MKKEHPFLKHSIPASIVLLFAGFGFAQLGSAIFVVPLSFIFRSGAAGSSLGAILGALVFLFLYDRAFRGEGFRGHFVTDWSREKFLFILLGAHLLFDLASVPIVGRIGKGSVSFDYFFLALCAGVMEETVSRAVPVSLLMRYNLNRKGILLAELLPAVFFGLVHLGNALVPGANFFSTVVQVFTSISAGILLGSVYIYTGNVLITMVFHFFYDVIAFMDINMIQGGVVVGELTAANYSFELVVTAINIAIAVYLLRRANTEKILERWRSIWNMSVEAAETDATETAAD